jgi:hypothetical protein
MDAGTEEDRDSETGAAVGTIAIAATMITGAALVEGRVAGKGPGERQI